MYLTSDELLKHMLGHHSVARWVCDHCASESEADQSFVFVCMEDWQVHMKTDHATSFMPSQLLSLSKVSQRRMLEPLGCPLCGYVAEYPLSSLDDHITKHLHGFALRCLPWGTGGNEIDSINAKSADASSSELDDGDEDDYEYLSVTEADPPTRLYQILATFQDRDTQVSYVYSEVKRLVHQHLPLLESQATSRIQAGQKARQLSLPRSIADLFPTPNSGSSHNQLLVAGNLLDYSSSASPSSYSHVDRLCESVDTYLVKITQILSVISTEVNPITLDDELISLYDVLLELTEQLQKAKSTPAHHPYGSTIEPEEINRFELTEVYSHPDAKVDIVFVHGLYGDPRLTWQSLSGTFWPSQLLPASWKSTPARILLYGYKADVNTFGHNLGISALVFFDPSTMKYKTFRLTPLAVRT
jgi:hypothetical protein